VRLARRDAPDQVLAVVAAAGSFAAISALFGSPLAGAFLLMEAVGIGGPMLRPILLPGLLASGIGTLVFIGLDSWTGHGTFSLTLPGLPAFPRPDVAEFLWAPVIGLAAAVLVAGIRRIAVPLRTLVDRRVVVAGPLVGLVIAGLAIGYGQITGHGLSDVLFSGQDQLPGLVSASADYTVGALLLLIVCKSLAYAGSLVAFRGGPTFPAIFLGAAGGIVLSHLPGLSLVPAIAMGLAATSAAMLQLPLSSVLIATVMLGTDGFTVMPLVILAVTVSYVASARLTPRPAPPAGGAETADATGPVSAAPTGDVARPGQTPAGSGGR
jgi:H+/Cl- antiporter ClcA